MGRDKLFDLLREECLLVHKRRRYTKTTNSNHWMRKYPDLVKGLSITHPEQLWVADITYLSIEKSFIYLHLVTDAYSKQIMGYCLSHTLAATASINALQMAISRRVYKTQIIHHSDRGLQYCSAGYVDLLAQNEIAISMTQDGNPYDNAIAERVNGILKDEFLLDDVMSNFDEAKKQTDQAILFYNNKRPHLSCQMLTPIQMHSQATLKIKKWTKKNYKNFRGSCNFIPSLQHL